MIAVILTLRNLVFLRCSFITENPFLTQFTFERELPK